ncbi:MAG TPA: aldo/keto reductase [Candidatus Paceibacterota bacterium]|nr:aldo/keto reductase [Verrucomicrobiota bacterium]HSA12036.1 aldo/keto reductase [Candidatus Paceibacterota bacterium]
MSNSFGIQRRRKFLKTVSAASAGAVFAGNAPATLAAAAPAIGPVPKRKFGRHEELVSSLALGGATLVRAGSVQEATRIVHAALDMGITFLDNAWEYSKGRAEEWMGTALQGKRDKVFLMTKVCTHNPGQESKDKALAMLEDSLRRLKTDHLDLWQVHQILTDAEADSIFIPDGVLGAIEQAKKQGKIRYCGFTGHANPKVHLRVLAHKYPFDSVQMPLSVFDADDNGFQRLVLPEARKQGLAPLAMKTLGGNAKPIKDGLVTAEECLRYALSLPVATVVSGIDTMEWLRTNARIASSFKPLTREEMAALEQRCSSKKQYEYYRQWAYLDGSPPNALPA